MNSEVSSVLPGGVVGARAVVSSSVTLAHRDPDAFMPIHPCAVLDRHGRFVAASPAFAAASGSVAAALVGCRLDEVWTVDPEPGQPAELSDLLVRVARGALAQLSGHPTGAP